MKILAFGSRTFSDEVMVKATITGLWHTRPGTEGFTVVVGHDPTVDDRSIKYGADLLAYRVAQTLEWCQVRTYPAEWKVHAEGWCPGQRCFTRLTKHAGRHAHRDPYCMVAGPRRNQQMIDAEHTDEDPIDLAVGFIDKPLKTSRGSSDMRNRLVTAEIAVSVLWSPNRRPIESFRPPGFAWGENGLHGHKGQRRLKAP